VAAETLRPLILICDDERPLRELVKAALGGNYRFEEAADTLEAERILEQDRPALLVLDVMLPGKSGLELLEELRERPETADIPVVIISAWHGEYEVTALGTGANAFLGKPFDPDELAETVERLVAA
jgi:two-component system, OmpR family, phosphate regulon response regulator PhoB